MLSKAHTIFAYDKYKVPLNSKDNLEELARNAEVVFVCVPTPMKRSGEMDYSAIYGSLDSLFDEFQKQGRSPEDVLVTIRSTAVSGTTDKLAMAYSFPIAFNPEFLTERNAVKDMENTDRIILGVEDERNRKTP